MDLFHAMEVFVCVVERESFTRAGEALEMTTGMVSHHITNLEQHLGVRLLNRTTRILSLTDEGRAYLEHCKHILGEVQETRTLLGKASATLSGRVRVGLSSTKASGLVLPVWTRFRERYPEIELELNHTRTFFGASYEGFDVMLRFGPFHDSDLVVKRLSRTLTVTVASPAYLARCGEPETPAALGEHDCLNFIDPVTGQASPWLFHENGADRRVPVRGKLSFNEGKVRVEAAASGLGITQTSTYHIMDALRDGRLKPILRDFTSPNGPEIGILYVKHRYLPARVRAFVDFMVETYPPDKVFSID